MTQPIWQGGGRESLVTVWGMSLGFVIFVGFGIHEIYTTVQDNAEAAWWTERYRSRAEGGDASAQFDLGLSYATGDGVSQDDAEAVRWYRLAADQGLAVAQYNLGLIYDNGRGVPQDDAEAARWFRLAADQGQAAAQYNLAAMYSNGRGVPQDYVEAARWYRLAADQGYGVAQYNLGVMYANGQGVPLDDVQAHMWFNLAASLGTRKVRENTVQARDRAAGRMDPTQIAEAQRLAREWDAAHPREP
jgi:TPR repeat protein